MRLLLAFSMIALAACAPAPAPPAAEAPKTDPANEAWYGPAADELAGMNREVETLLRSGRADAAAALITKSQPLINRLLSAPRPTLAAMEAVSDSDDLYGRMLVANKRYGEARLLFQKNVARWKAWKPQTPQTARRLKVANDEIADCDRSLAK
jgi:hypothetical protein